MKLRTVGLITTLALGLLAAPLPAKAQQAVKVYRIGYLHYRPGPTANERAFLKGLRGLGWVEGKNIHIEYRWAAGKRDRLPALAEELVRLKVDLIVTGTWMAGMAAKKATTKIPIVTVAAADAVQNGLVASLARPGGNITGMSEQYTDLHLKLLEVLHETLPKVKRVAFLRNPTSRMLARILRGFQAMSPAMGLTIQSIEVRHPDEVESALEAAAQERVGALVVPAAMYTANGRAIAKFAAKHRVPVLSLSKNSVEKNFGLLAYAPSWVDMYRRAATYVDKVLKGAKPADLPIDQPKKFDLIINLKTAKALGITIPPNVLYQATKVIK